MQILLTKGSICLKKHLKCSIPPPPPQIFLCNNVEFLHTAIVLQLVTTVKKLILIQQQLTGSFRADVQKTQLLSLFFISWVKSSGYQKTELFPFHLVFVSLVFTRATEDYGCLRTEHKYS